MTQTDLLRHLAAELERLGIPYMVVGSIASGIHGEPRMTRDIDVVIEVSSRQVPALCRAFPDDAYYVSPEAAAEAVRNQGQFNVIHPTSGHKIDLLIGKKSAWGRSQISRRQRKRILPDLEVYCAAPEDVILSKMQYYQEGGSEKHLRDITGILKVSDEQVDRRYVAEWADRLGVAEIWQAILRRLEL